MTNSPVYWQFRLKSKEKENDDDQFEVKSIKASAFPTNFTLFSAGKYDRDNDDFDSKCLLQQLILIF